MQELAIKGQTHTNSLGMQFVRIEPGSFMMGSENASLSDELTEGKAHLRDGDWDEHPVHEVTLSTPFYIGVFQVTNAQYAAFDATHRELPSLQNVGFHRTMMKRSCLSIGTMRHASANGSLRKRGCLIDCRLRQNGNMSVAPVQRRIFIPVIPCPLSFIKMLARVGTRMQDAVAVRKKLCRCMSGKLRRTRGVYTICTAMWRSGAEIGTDPTNRSHKSIRWVRKMDCIALHAVAVIPTLLCYLRSANRMGAVPEDKHWYIGFRIVCGEMPQTSPTPAPKVALWGRGVKQEVASSPAPEAPYFAEPLTFVKIPDGSNGPLFSAHNHVPAITECPNGDMFAAWYSCVTERGRELTVAASRLRFGESEWEPAEPSGDRRIGTIMRHLSGGMRTGGCIISTGFQLLQHGVPWR